MSSASQAVLQHLHAHEGSADQVAGSNRWIHAGAGGKPNIYAFDPNVE